MNIGNKELAKYPQKKININLILAPIFSILNKKTVSYKWRRLLTATTTN